MEGEIKQKYKNGYRVIEKMFKIQNYVDPEFFVRFYKTNFDIEVRTHWKLKISKKQFSCDLQLQYQGQMALCKFSTLFMLIFHTFCIQMLKIVVKVCTNCLYIFIFLTFLKIDSFKKYRGAIYQLLAVIPEELSGGML